MSLFRLFIVVPSEFAMYPEDLKTLTNGKALDTIKIGVLIGAWEELAAHAIMLE